MEISICLGKSQLCFARVFMKRSQKGAPESQPQQNLKQKLIL